MTKASSRSVAVGGLTVIAAAVAGLVLGSVVGTFAVATASDAPPAPIGSATTNWAKNAHGLTYGSGMDAKSPQDEPDLIEVLATNGKVGYSLRSDLEGPDPTSPQEALAQQVRQAGKDQVIPVYKADGTTKIGVFIVRHSASSVSAGSLPSN